MVIYIDILLFINMIINYLILSLSQKMLCYKTSQSRILLASLLGAVSSLVVFLPTFTNLFSYLIKLLCTALLCFIAFKTQNLRAYLKSILYTYTVSVIFCGIMIFVYQTAKPQNMAIINDVIYFDINPLMLIAISVCIYLIAVFVQRIFSTNPTSTIASLSFVIERNTFSCIAKLDTGCSVIEPFSGAPVIIAQKSLFNNNKINVQRIVPYRTLGHDGFLKAVKADKIYIDKKEINKEVYIGIFEGIIDNDIEAIINTEIIR